ALPLGPRDFHYQHWQFMCLAMPRTLLRNSKESPRSSQVCLSTPKPLFVTYLRFSAHQARRPEVIPSLDVQLQLWHYGELWDRGHQMDSILADENGQGPGTAQVGGSPGPAKMAFTRAFPA
ncbi:mCG146011, partial [Mus musculus]